MSASRGHRSRRSPNQIRYRSVGADINGMANMPKSRLAREAQITYATPAPVADFYC